MGHLSLYTLAAAFIAACFVVLWTTTASELFWDKLISPARRFWTRKEALIASAICAALNVCIVSVLFAPDSSLRLFIFFEVLFYLTALALINEW